ISGVLEYRIRRNKNDYSYFIQIAGEQFMVNQWLQEQFEHETVYTIHYAPHSRILLSAHRGAENAPL
ncbi:MAG: hypothetical protein ACPG7F_18140, partial [Aggregatilineales bacterium]